MSRLDAMNDQKRLWEQQQEQDTFWPDLCHRISEGQVIPIIGTTVFYEQIFDMDGDGVLGIGEGEVQSSDLSLEEQLAEDWGKFVGFPFNPRHRLAQVALYNRVVRSRDDLSAKLSYLTWLKEALLHLAKDDPDVDPTTIEEQKKEVDRSSFADIAVELGYPHPLKGQTDVLAQLAQLNLPIYVTTSYFDFLERAILANGRNPRTQVCFWNGIPLRYLDESHRIDHGFNPTPENPLVYHLFGLETYPESLVLTEDDYLDFLVAIIQDSSNQGDPRFPLYLRRALTESSLILLGYQLHHWDFRVLFRGLINTMPARPRKFNVAIQLDPNTQKWVISTDDTKLYLKGYFEPFRFSVEYSASVNFVNRLWKEWDKWRR
ncbi:MAG: SIR2 family protein [Candidatus Promineifilaceae bacterium]